MNDLYNTCRAKPVTDVITAAYSSFPGYWGGEWDGARGQLWKRVIEDPQDDTSRLIYADALDDWANVCSAGDSFAHVGRLLAEIVRLQVKHSREMCWKCNKTGTPTDATKPKPCPCGAAERIERINELTASPCIVPVHKPITEFGQGVGGKPPKLLDLILYHLRGFRYTSQSMDWQAPSIVTLGSVSAIACTRHFWTIYGPLVVRTYPVQCVLIGDATPHQQSNMPDMATYQFNTQSIRAFYYSRTPYPVSFIPCEWAQIVKRKTYACEVIPYVGDGFALSFAGYVGGDEVSRLVSYAALEWARHEAELPDMSGESLQYSQNENLLMSRLLAMGNARSL